MKSLMMALVILVSGFASAETCLEISHIQNGWSRTPQLLCIDEKIEASTADITLKEGHSFDERIIAVFHLDLLSRARCLDCNQDLYGLAEPSNSSFNSLQVRFDGMRDMETMTEEGVVYIGSTKFFYQSIKK